MEWFDSISDTVSGWFSDDTVDNVATDVQSAGDLGIGNPGSYGGDNTGDSMYGIGSTFDTDSGTWQQDYNDESLWGTVSTGLQKAGSATMDFLNTKAGTTMATQALGVLGKYLMEEDARDAQERARTSRLMMGGGGGGAGGSGGGGVEATTSSLGKW